MKIVHVIDYFQPQWGYQETYLAREQQRLGHEVMVITCDSPRSELYGALSGQAIAGSNIKGYRVFLEDGIKVVRLKTAFKFRYRVWLAGLGALISDLSPDIVHMHNIANITSLRLARLKLAVNNFRLIYDEHSAFSSIHRMLRIGLSPLFKLCFRGLLLKAADGFIAIAEESKEIMQRYCGIPENRINIIPLGADHRLFRFDSSARDGIRNQLGIKKEEIVIVYAGKVTKEKGVDIFVDACMQILKRYANSKILIVGSGYGGYIESLKSKIKISKFQDRFIWRNAVKADMLSKIYCACDIGIWPRQSSGTMLEAMACNLPVIVSDEPAAQERLRYNNGLVYKRGDVSDLVVQIERLINDPSLRKTMGHNGRRLIENKLNWELITGETIAYYLSVGAAKIN